MIYHFCTHAQFFHFRRPLNCRPVYLSTCQPVYMSICRPFNLSTCRPVILSTCHLEHGYIWSLHSVAGVRGAWPQAFRGASMPTSLNLTYIHPYDCPCFARMRSSFTSVDLSTVDLSTCLPVTCNMALYGVCILLRGSGGLANKHSVVNQCLIH